MSRLTEMPNDRYKSLMVANAEKQTRLLATIAANSEALDGRIDQLQSRCNQILARVAETESRFAAPLNRPGEPEMPALICGGIGLPADIVRRINCGDELSDGEVAALSDPQQLEAGNLILNREGR